MPAKSDSLTIAMKRLSQFRKTWEPGDEIDEISHLTAGDLDLIIDALQPHADLEPGSLTADDLADMA